MTTGILAVAAVSALATLTLTARPLVAIPGGLIATLGWWITAAAAADAPHLLRGAGAPAPGPCTAAYTLADAWRVRARARRRRADDETAGGGRCRSPRSWTKPPT